MNAIALPDEGAKLSVTRATDRKIMARELMRVAQELDAVVTISPAMGRAERIEIELGDLQLGVTICGDGRTGNTFLMPWNLKIRSDAKMSVKFGLGQGAEVNPLHRAKCTAVANGFWDLVRKVKLGLAMVHSGEAFE